MAAAYRLAALCTLCAPSFAMAVALTPGNIIVSNSPFGAQDLFEYTPAGVRVQQIPVPNPADGRDLILDANGHVQIYNGTFSPTLTAYNPASNTFSSRTFAGWSTVNNLTYGGIAANGRYVYASDMNTAGGSETGVVRFDLQGGPTTRFATGLEPLDLTIGRDGFLYTLTRGAAFNGGGNQIDVFNAQTMAFIRSFNLPGEHRGIAVDANGDIYTAQRDGGSSINRFNFAGVLLDSIADPGVGGLGDIDLNASGGIVVASHGGTLLITTTALDSVTTFQTRSSNGMNFAAWVQAPIPEPSALTLLVAGLGATLLKRRRPV